MESVVLEGRLAQCSYCKKEQPSSRDLAFFMFHGEGSKHATEKCGECGFYDVTHMEVNPSTGRAGHLFGKHDFVVAGAREFDEYYCGCRGWD